jgi:hypothetical protein
MIPVTQTLFGRAEGNCLAACVASILELDIADVPNFCADQSDGSWLRKLADWLAEEGMCAVHASFVDGDPGVVPAPEDLATMASWMKLRRIGFAIVSGYTERGLSHSTVWFDGELVHDPHPSQNPLINVVDMIVLSHRDPRASEGEHLTEVAGLVSNAAAVREQHSNRVERLLGRIETLKAEVAQLRADVRVEAKHVERAGVTRAHAVAWAKARGGYVDRLYSGTADDIAAYAGSGTWHGKSGLDILDEMSAMEVPS